MQLLWTRYPPPTLGWVFMKHNFRDIVPKPDDPRVAGICDRDAYQHIEQRLTNPRIKLAVEGWKDGRDGDADCREVRWALELRFVSDHAQASCMVG